MKNGCLFLNWAFGIFFLLIGSHISKVFIFGGLLLAIISLFLLPPIRSLAYSITRIELSPRVRGAAIMLILFLSCTAMLGSKIREDLEFSMMKARDMVELKHAQSQKRHREFFWVETWKHSDYVKKHGESLCAFCHGLEPGALSLFGPRCVNCHRDLQAFERSLQPLPSDPANESKALGSSNNGASE